MSARQLVRRAGTVIGSSISAGVLEEEVVFAQPISPLIAAEEYEPGFVEQNAQLIFAPASEVGYPDVICCLTPTQQNIQNRIQNMSIELSRNSGIQSAVRNAFLNNGGLSMLRNGEIDPLLVQDLTNNIIHEGQCLDTEEDEDAEDEPSMMTQVIIAGAVIILLGAAIAYCAPAIAPVANRALAQVWARIVTSVTVGGIGGGAATSTTTAATTAAGTAASSSAMASAAAATAATTAATAATVNMSPSAGSKILSWFVYLGVSVAGLFTANESSKL